jgi:O-antigen/teichoic acid export membrane protein
MHPRKFIRDSLGFAATQYVIRGLLMIRGVVGARLLGPLEYGAWAALQLLMDYGMFAPIGTQQGLDQAVPARIVENDAERLDRIKRAGLFNILLLTGVFVSLCVVYVLIKPNRIVGTWGLGGALLALACVVLVNVGFYFMTLLRSHGNITAVSGWYFVQGLIGTVLGLALIPVAGMWGLLIGWVAGSLAALFYVRTQGRGIVPLVPRAAPECRDLVRVGFPMFVFMASSMVMRTLDRLIILKFLGTRSLGYYSLAVMVLAFLLYLPDSIAFVLYPRLLREYRAGDNRPEAIRGAVVRSLRGLAVVVPALCGVAYLFSRDAVMVLLPDYLPGITAVRVLCFGAGALAFVNLSSIVLMTLGRQNVLVPVALAMTALGAGLDYLAVRMGHGISGVARATLVAYSADGALLLWLALGSLGLGMGPRLAVVARAFLPLATGFVIAYTLEKLLPGARGLPTPLALLRALGGAALFTGLYVAAMLPLIRGLGLRQFMLEMNLPVGFPGRRAGTPRP